MDGYNYKTLRDSDLFRLGGADSEVSCLLKWFRKCQTETNPKCDRRVYK